ncbi:MAG TPA: glycosyltransferase family 4 protein [Candidatus Angelobacter sp.]|nr:glycosyltransferase family 4 protein [Candidatus Angelobacter sp.]
MQILFFTENFPPETNAAASRVYERALYWIKWGHSVTVITTAPNFPHGKIFDGYKNRWYQIEDMQGIRVVRVKSFISANQGVILRLLDFLSFMCTGFLAGLRQKRPDVIVATSPQFFTAVAAWAASRWRAIPFVFELGDLWPSFVAAVGAMKPNFGLRLMEKLELHLYRQSAYVAALTESFKQNLISRGIDADKIHVVMNGVEMSKFYPMPRDPLVEREFGVENCFVAGYIGTHGMAHDLGRILDAAELMRDERDVRFLFVGAGAERNKLVAEARKRLLENVSFIPSQPRERMAKVWSVCDVALIYLKNIPAFETVIPSKMFEAMAMGVPMLFCAPRGEGTRIVEREQAGLWVPPQDPAALVDALRRLRQDAALREQLGRNGRAAAPRYSRETQARELLRVLALAAAKRPLSSRKTVSVRE